MSDLSESVPILTGVLATQVPDSQVLDIHTYRHRIMGIVVLEHESGFNPPILPLIRTRAADRLEGLLVM
jgi:hypothetical protein